MSNTYYSPDAPDPKPRTEKRRRATSRRRDELRAEQKKRREVFMDMPAWPIDTNAKLTMETVRQADALFGRLEPRLKQYKLDEKRRYWRALTHAANRARWHGGCLYYPRNRRHPEFSNIRLQVIEAAVATGFFVPYTSKRGAPKMSRIIPTPELIEQMDPWTFEPDETHLVIVRDKATHEVIDYPTNHALNRRLARVNRINGQHKITCQIKDAWGGVVTRQLRPVHYALYHDHGWRHGRIYTGKFGHQQLSKLERSTIKFDDEPCVELDYSALHIRMIYHQAGRECRGDPYALWGSETTPDLRQIAKTLVNASINATGPRAAVSACNRKMSARTDKGGMWKTGKGAVRAAKLRNAMKRAGTTFKEVRELVTKCHPILAGNRSEDATETRGEDLMTEDGELAQDILYHFAKRSIPCLGVHDSFIVPRHAKAELHEIMSSKYEERFGFLPIVK